MLEQRKLPEPKLINGLNITEFENIVEAVREQPGLAKFLFRGTNVWDNGARNRTTFRGFYGAGEEHGAENRAFVVDADDPPVFLGSDKAPTPVEYLLHALSACLTSSIVYKAAAHGIVIESVESTIDGDLDARKFLELSEDGRTGYQNIRATFKVKSNASPEVIKELAEFSPVLDVITRGTPVSIHVEQG